MTGGPVPSEAAKRHQQSSFIKALANRVINMIAEEMAKDECRFVVKHNIVSPLISMIYMEIFPYILIAGVIIILMLLFSFATLICFLVFYVFRRS